MFDPNSVRLGRAAVRRDPRTFRLGAYLNAAALPQAPAQVNYGAKVKDWLLLANDRLSDCTAAGILHAIMIWKSQSGDVPTFTDADAVSLYSQLCGYDPADPTTDQGGVELDILNSWRKAPIQGVPLAAYVAVDPRNWEHVKLALYLAGTLYMGIALPTTAQAETLWKDTSGIPGSWGGHCVVASAYDDRGTCLRGRTLTCITWGKQQLMTPEWLATYCDEIYAPLSPAWLGLNGLAPNGLNLAQLDADIARL